MSDAAQTGDSHRLDSVAQGRMLGAVVSIKPPASQSVQAVEKPIRVKKEKDNA